MGKCFGIRGRDDGSVVEKDLMVEKRIIESLKGLDLKKQIEIILAFLEKRGSKIEITRYINFNERIEEINEDLISYLASIKNTDILLILAKLLRNNKKIYNIIIEKFIEIIKTKECWSTGEIIKIASNLNEIRVSRAFADMIISYKKNLNRIEIEYFRDNFILHFIDAVPNAPKKELLLLFCHFLEGYDEQRTLARIIVSEEQKVHNLEKKLELVKKMKGKSISRSKIKVFEESKKYVKKR